MQKQRLGHLDEPLQVSRARVRIIIHVLVTSARVAAPDRSVLAMPRPEDTASPEQQALSADTGGLSFESSGRLSLRVGAKAQIPPSGLCSRTFYQQHSRPGRHSVCKQLVARRSTFPQAQRSALAPPRIRTGFWSMQRKKPCGPKQTTQERTETEEDSLRGTQRQGRLSPADVRRHIRRHPDSHDMQPCERISTLLLGGPSKTEPK